MRRNVKFLIGVWIKRLLLLTVLGLIVWANVIRLKDNNFSNHEKAIDYGLIKDDDKLINPVIAAIFYAGKNNNKSDISTYFNHSGNYKKQNIKMVIVPKKLAAYSKEVVEKLYEEINLNNQINKVLLVYDKDTKNDIKLHKKMLLQIMGAQNVQETPISQQSLTGEKKVEEYLSEPQNLVVFLADLDKGLNDKNSDFLTGEAVFFAQQHHYQINVFDIIDTQLAKALDKDYETLYPLETMKAEPLLAKQKRNLKRYKRHYWHLLKNYFELNLLQMSQDLDDAVMPLRSEENYRLYDRGRLVLKAYDENYLEIFEKAEMRENLGIAYLVSDAIKSLVSRGLAFKAKFFKIYLLTDLEPVHQEKDTMLMSYLDEDDGIYAEYKNYSALLVADDRPDNPEDLAKAVRHKAGIPDETADEKIDYYRFKTVEMNYGD
ncbi:MAG: hypothetical protein MSS98_01765 [Alphaproteobacteria bacterium]|nr:hypothetical protein [Alphaproteobacteria bacterium]MDY4690100.1 hypothetical protein [Alphaproteobacteria bacterium]